MIDGQVIAHTSIKCIEFVRELTFAPKQSRHLLVYCDFQNRILLTHYDVKGKQDDFYQAHCYASIV